MKYNTTTTTQKTTTTTTTTTNTITKTTAQQKNLQYMRLNYNVYLNPLSYTYITSNYKLFF